MEECHWLFDRSNIDDAYGAIHPDVMDVHISLHHRGNLTVDCYRQLKQAILDGRLRPGDPLPATRELARRLEVSRNTVMNAYEQLIAEGFLLGRVGAGTFVSTVPIPASVARAAPRATALRPLPIWRSLAISPKPRAVGAYDFSVGSPDPKLFPWDEFRRLVARQVRDRRRPAGYPLPGGDPRLRAAIARHIGVSRSVQAAADDIIVTSGAQQGFDLIGRVLVEPGTCVAVENPGYPPARHAMQALGARVVPVPVDAEGIVVEALPADATLVYVTPAHQFPLGMPMSLSRRIALLAWAERNGAAIIEDDYDSEFRFDGRPLDPLQSLDRSGRVLYVGTFSKVLLPTLRIGFVVAPASLMPGLHAAKRLTDSHGPFEMQRAVAELIDDGLFARHTRRLLRVYRERRDALAAALTRHAGDALIQLPACAGLHTSAYFVNRRIDTTLLVEQALGEGITIEPLHDYYCGRARAGLALGYGMIATSKIEEGIKRLASCIRRTESNRR